MEFSHSWKIKLSEDEAREIIAKHITSLGEYFVYAHDVSFVPLTNGKVEILVKNATKISSESNDFPPWA